jgi:hypothetical protein
VTNHTFDSNVKCIRIVILAFNWKIFFSKLTNKYWLNEAKNGFYFKINFISNCILLKSQLFFKLNAQHSRDLSDNFFLNLLRCYHRFNRCHYISNIRNDIRLGRFFGGLQQNNFMQIIRFECIRFDHVVEIGSYLFTTPRRLIRSFSMAVLL